MKIDIWSDVVCPFCYIGKHHLEEAISRLPELDIEVQWHSFELDPQAPKEPETDIYDTLARKYNQSRDWAQDMTVNVHNMAEEAGLEMDMGKLKPTNSFDAHQLIHLARQNNKEGRVIDALFRAYFVEGLNIADRKTLHRIGTDNGLDADTITEVFSEERFNSAVNHDIMQAKNIGINGVPFFLVDRRFGISGAQPADRLFQTLKEIHDKEGRFDTFKKEEDETPAEFSVE